MKNSAPKKYKILIALLCLLLIFTAYALWADKALTSRAFEIKDKKIPSAFDGFCIAHVSDLHNTEFGKDNERLLGKLKDMKPDIIAVTGDSVDSRRTNIDITVDFFRMALEIAPVYYVTGNHEARIEEYPVLEAALKELGVIYAEDVLIPIGREGEKITLCGVADPVFSADYLFDDEAYAAERALDSLNASDNFTVLLSHRPEFFELYCKKGFSLVLSGHAHGGQFRLPFVGGFIAPGQGLFPEYDSGLYEKEGTRMIVSRGLGNSIIPLRLFNRPEVISVILKSE